MEISVENRRHVCCWDFPVVEILCDNADVLCFMRYLDLILYINRTNLN